MENIIIAIKNIREKGEFCAKRTTPIDKLYLEIKKFGRLELPLAAHKVKALIKFAKPAKFGWRNKTLLDKEVRNAWEISKSNIKIYNIVWNKELKPILDLLKKDLGLPNDSTLKANLHNLLIYEPGQFFSPHQDSEKLDGMVASLVVVLPSAHRGGSLIIDHHGEKKTFRTGQFPLDKLTFIAFYADCHHEVKEIKDGYRVTLTYNLILENHDKKVLTPTKTNFHDEVIQSLRAYFNDQDQSKEASTSQHQTPKKWIYLLDYSYTQKGLSWNHLKNGDRLRAEALKAAADALDLEIHLALADIQETWNCEVDYDSYEYRHQRKYYDDEEEDDEDDVDLKELIDSSTELRHWIDRENNPLNYKECHISTSQICWTKASNEFEPFQSEYEGYMGNYGNTMDRWYHRAAIILWRKKDHYPVLFKMDQASVINELQRLTKKKSQEAKIHQVVSGLLPYWSELLRQNSDPSLMTTVFKLALYVKDSQLAQTMLNGFDIRILSPEIASLFLSLQSAYGTSWCVNVFKEWAKPKDHWGTTLKCEKISQIVKNLSVNKDNHKELTDWLLAYQLQKIKKYNISSKKNDNRVQLLKASTERIKEIIDFIQACFMVNNDVIHAEAINYMMDDIELYPILDIVNVLNCFEKSLSNSNLKQWQYQKLFDYILNTLKCEQNLGARKTDDWSIKEKLSCSCQDCIILGEFLQSSNQKSKVWPLSKDRRAHIHRKIDGLGIPVTHQTEHTGSPHKLILTKTDELHSQAKHRFERIGKELQNLAKKKELLEITETF